MGKLHKKTLFLFRRDLRLEDNLALLAALEKSDTVLPAFIFDPRQCDREQNGYFSEAAFHVLLTSLEELNEALGQRGTQLYVFYGNPAVVVETLLHHDDIDAVYMGKDYTPFARKRDKEIADVVEKYNGGSDADETHKVCFTRVADTTLSPIETIRTKQNKLYSVFTPFYRNAATYDVPVPRKNNFSNYFSVALSPAARRHAAKLANFSTQLGDRELAQNGGRTEALALLRDTDFLQHYRTDRNRPDINGTSQLSLHHKFGTISIRETYAATADFPKFKSELYWRDFYYYIAYHFPVVFKKSFLPWASELQWENNKKQFTAWKDGRTGVPIVDAAMRELAHTGWMHNRNRMIVASYLTKNLLIDWRWGEQYFAQQLIDYDPSQNNGGWQWSASVGADPRPLRIFNPYTQAQKYDPHADYIKKWVPELRDVPSSTLTNGVTQDFSQLADYPAPLVDQKETYHRARAAYRQAKDAYQSDNATQN